MGAGAGRQTRNNRKKIGGIYAADQMDSIVNLIQSAFFLASSLDVRTARGVSDGRVATGRGIRSADFVRLIIISLSCGNGSANRF